MTERRAEGETEGIEKIKHLLSKGAEIVSVSANTPAVVDYDNDAIGLGLIPYKPAPEWSTQEIEFDTGETIRFENLSKNGVKEITEILYEEYIKNGEEMEYIKPKTKTIKQWERKYLQGDLVMTMIVSGPDDSNNMECWVGEAYEAEYEVPND